MLLGIAALTCYLVLRGLTLITAEPHFESAHGLYGVEDVARAHRTSTKANPNDRNHLLRRAPHFQPGPVRAPPQDLVSRELDNQRLTRRVKHDGEPPPHIVKHGREYVERIVPAHGDIQVVEQQIKETEERIQEWKRFPEVHHQTLKDGGISKFQLNKYRLEFNHRQNLLKLQAEKLRHDNQMQEATKVEKVLRDLGTTWDGFYKVVEASCKHREEMRAQMIKMGTKPDVRHEGPQTVTGSGTGSSGRQSESGGETGKNSGGSTHTKHLRRELSNKELVRRSNPGHSLSPELNIQMKALFHGGRPDVGPFLRETHRKCQEWRSSIGRGVRQKRVSKDDLKEYMIEIHHRRRVLVLLDGHIQAHRRPEHDEEQPLIQQALEELRTTYRDLREASSQSKRSRETGSAKATNIKSTHPA